MLFLDYDDVPLLSILLGMPCVGAFFVSFINTSRAANIKKCALWVQGAVLLLLAIIGHQFDPGLTGCQMAEKMRWVSRLGLHYDVAIDTVSLTLIVCAAGLSFVATLCSTAVATARYKMSIILSLLLESGVMGCFCANNVLLLYLFLEVIFFAFPFFLNISVRGSSTSIPTVMAALFSSLALFLTLIRVSHMGTHSLDVARYDPIVLPTRWALYFLGACLLRLEVCLWGIRRYARQPHASSILLISALGPVFLSQLLLLFRLRILFAFPFPWLSYIVLPMLGTVMVSLLRLFQRLRQGEEATLEFLPLVARWTCALVFLANQTSTAGMVSGIFLMVTYALGVACFFLVPKEQERVKTTAIEVVILALLGAPCSGGFWAHMALLRQFLVQRQVVGCCLSLFVLLSSLLMGCFYGRCLAKRIEPATFPTRLEARLSRALFWCCWGLLILSTLCPFLLESS